MHEKYLETKKFPSAILKVSSVKIDGSDCEFKGELEIKNLSKPVGGTCKISSLSDKLLEANINFEFDINDYPIGVPSYLGITVADSVKISSSFIAKVLQDTH